MKIIFLILGISVFASIYYIFFNSDETKTTEKTQNDNKQNQNDDYKQNQDDKDTVVETNRKLLIELDEIKIAIKTIKDEQLEQQQSISSLKNDSLKQLNIKSNDKSIVQKGDNFVKQGKNLIDSLKKELNPASQQTTNDINSQNYIINNSENRASQNNYIWQNTLKSSNIKPADIDNNISNSNIEKAISDDSPTLTQQSIPKYTIPSNSVFSATLLTGLLGRIPINDQVTDPYRFSIQITDKALIANHHISNNLEGAIASGTAQGDFLLSCVKAHIDSITFIFEDGTISENNVADIATLTDEFGYPCIKGELVTNAPEYLTTSTVLSVLSSATKAFAEAEQTTITDSSGNTSRQTTGDIKRFAGYNAVTGGIDNVQQWVNDRASSTFDVIFVPSGKKIKLITQLPVEINYDTLGRKLDHVVANNKDYNNAELD